MIQRIQSVFLLVVVLCGIAWIIFIQFIETSLSDWDNLILGSSILNSISILLTLFNIFSYKNRKLQIKISSFLIILNILICLISFLLANYFIIDKLYPLCFPLIATVFSFLARKYIKKDEELVRSSDRIR